jgi:hypothetical protein
MAMVWILFGTLVLAAAFFIVSFAQVLGIESRLRHLVVETEGRLARTYNVRLVPPGTAAPDAPGRKAPPDPAPSQAEDG